MKVNREIKTTLKARAKSIVDERILPPTLDEIADWTGELMGKLTTLDPEADQKQTDKVFNEIYEGLIRETISQLEGVLKKKSHKH